MTSVLHATERKEFRRSHLRKIRSEGGIPAVIYGADLDSKAIFVEASHFLRTINQQGRNGVISLDIEGMQHSVVLKDFQEDPIRNEVIHADFFAVNMSTDLTADVQVVLVGDAAGVKDGGVLQQSLHAVSITAKPNDIPNTLEYDISNLQVGETVTVGDLKSSETYHINHDDEEVVASILPPKVEDEIHSGEQQESGHPDREEGRETEASGT